MKKIIETKNLTLQVANKLIGTLQLEILPGDRWGILGPNGCGKTTLLHTLAGLRSFAGEILLEGKLLTKLSTKKIAQTLGILLQDTLPIFPQRVFEYCLAGRHPHAKRFAWENAEDVAIVNHALHCMELSSQSQQNVMTLSGGERRRLALATLLTQMPRIYLLDEPTNHLDLRHQVRVLNHFTTLAEQQAAVVMSLHDVNLAQHYCNKIILLFGEGKILHGSSEEMLTIENLTKLYQHPLDKKVMWAPKNFTTLT